MTNKKRGNKSRSPTGYTPPAKKNNIDPLSSSAQRCPQSNYYFVSCLNCKQTFIHELSTEINTNHCFTPVFDHSKVTCNLDCSFDTLDTSCPYVPPSAIPTTSTTNDESNNPTPVDSPTPSRPNSPTHLSNANTCETSNVTSNLIGDTNMNTNPNTNLDQDFEMIDGNQSITQVQKTKSYAEITTPIDENKKTKKPDLPLFSSIIPFNEALPLWTGESTTSLLRQINKNHFYFYFIIFNYYFLIYIY